MNDTLVMKTCVNFSRTKSLRTGAFVLLALFYGFSSPAPLAAQTGSGPVLQPPAGMSPAEFERIYKDGANLQTIFRAIYAGVRPSVVRVMAEVSAPTGQEIPPALLKDPFFRRFFPQQPRGSRKSVSFGTGFIINASGLIVTNRHVVGDAQTVKVHLHDGTVLDGQVRGGDELTDVALVQVKSAKPLQPARLGDSDDIQVGDIAIAVGNPFGLDGTFTTGVISGLHRAGLDESGLKFIQTDASINQGNSGGPLLNLNGEVIGINRMIYSPSGGSIGIGFAIPVTAVQPVIQQIAETGKFERPLLGVKIDAVQDARGNRGALIVEVVGGSSAHSAGLVPGDVIIAIDKKSIKGPDDLSRQIQRKRVGDAVQLDVVRKGRRFVVNTKLKSIQ
jgi:S1-C subfamily serine protease